MRKLHTLLAILGLGVLSACTSIERTAIPSAEISDTRWESFSAGSPTTIDHSAWDSFLSTYRVEGADGIARLKYETVSAGDWTALKSYISTLENSDVASLDRPEQLAYWINLYNAKTIDLVLEAYPVASIREIEGGVLKTGPWDKQVLAVAGKPLSLNDIEHKIVRPIWADARVHYAFNCAALGCPNLAAQAYTGSTIEQFLDRNARAYVNDPRGFRFDGDQLTASKIYAWFVEDFGGNDAGVIAHAVQYADPNLAARLEAKGSIDNYAYDWGLNAAQRLPGS